MTMPGVQAGRVACGGACASASDTRTCCCRTPQASRWRTSPRIACATGRQRGRWWAATTPSAQLSGEPERAVLQRVTCVAQLRVSQADMPR